MSLNLKQELRLQREFIRIRKMFINIFTCEIFLFHNLQLKDICIDIIKKETERQRDNNNSTFNNSRNVAAVINKNWDSNNGSNHSSNNNSNSSSRSKSSNISSNSSSRKGNTVDTSTNEYFTVNQIFENYLKDCYLRRKRNIVELKNLCFIEKNILNRLFFKINIKDSNFEINGDCAYLYNLYCRFYLCVNREKRSCSQRNILFNATDIKRFCLLLQYSSRYLHKNGYYKYAKGKIKELLLVNSNRRKEEEGADKKENTKKKRRNRKNAFLYIRVYTPDIKKTYISERNGKHKHERNEQIRMCYYHIIRKEKSCYNYSMDRHNFLKQTNKNILNRRNVLIIDKNKLASAMEKIVYNDFFTNLMDSIFHSFFSINAKIASYRVYFFENENNFENAEKEENIQKGKIGENEGTDEKHNRECSYMKEIFSTNFQKEREFFFSLFCKRLLTTPPYYNFWENHLIRNYEEKSTLDDLNLFGKLKFMLKESIEHFLFITIINCKKLYERLSLTYIFHVCLVYFIFLDIPFCCHINYFHKSFGTDFTEGMSPTPKNIVGTCFPCFYEKLKKTHISVHKKKKSLFYFIIHSLYYNYLLSKIPFDNNSFLFKLFHFFVYHYCVHSENGKQDTLGFSITKGENFQCDSCKNVNDKVNKITRNLFFLVLFKKYNSKENRVQNLLHLLDNEQKESVRNPYNKRTNATRKWEKENRCEHFSVMSFRNIYRMESNEYKNTTKKKSLRSAALLTYRKNKIEIFFENLKTLFSPLLKCIYLKDVIYVNLFMHLFITRSSISLKEKKNKKKCDIQEKKKNCILPVEKKEMVAESILEASSALCVQDVMKKLTFYKYYSFYNYSKEDIYIIMKNRRCRRLYYYIKKHTDVFNIAHVPLLYHLEKYIIVYKYRFKNKKKSTTRKVNSMKTVRGTMRNIKCNAMFHFFLYLKGKKNTSLVRRNLYLFKRKYLYQIHYKKCVEYYLNHLYRHTNLFEIINSNKKEERDLYCIQRKNDFFIFNCKTRSPITRPYYEWNKTKYYVFENFIMLKKKFKIYFINLCLLFYRFCFFFYHTNPVIFHFLFKEIFCICSKCLNKFVCLGSTRNGSKSRTKKYWNCNPTRNNKNMRNIKNVKKEENNRYPTNKVRHNCFYKQSGLLIKYRNNMLVKLFYYLTSCLIMRYYAIWGHPMYSGPFGLPLF